jgi:hypothetical protein
MAKLVPGGHLFISYAHADAAYVLQLTQLLQEQGVPCWFDRARLELGSKFNRDIKDAIESCSCFVLVMTPASKASEYVEEERDLAKSLGKNLVPLLVEGEKHFGVARRKFVDLRDGRLPSADVVDYLRGLTRPSPSVAPSYQGAAIPNPTQALTVDHGQGMARYVVRKDAEGDSIVLVTESHGLTPSSLRSGPRVERLTLSADGSLLGAWTGESLQLADVQTDGQLSMWKSEFDLEQLLATHFDSDEEPVIVALARAGGVGELAADLLLGDGATVRRFRVEQDGGWESTPAAGGIRAVRAAALGLGWLVLSQDGHLIAIDQCSIDNTAGRNWIDVDGGCSGAAELVAGVRVEDGDAQLIAWRRLGGEPPEVRGLDLEVDDGGGELRVDVVRPRAGGEPERILVTAGRHTLGWLWDELAPVDPERLAAGGIPT